MQKVERFFEGSGLVLGKLWIGGIGIYNSVHLISKTKKGLIAEAEKRLKDGSLDGGMGFEYLIGARISIRGVRILQINGRSYTSTSYSKVYIGTLTNRDKRAIS